MALFDFHCENCGREFEVERPLGATGAVKCPHCSSTKTTKVFSAAGIVFKGSGFYVTDSKSKGGSSPASKPGKEIKPDTGSGASETPSTPAATPDDKI
jgi:putative FmdB family regulatory protein